VNTERIGSEDGVFSLSMQVLRVPEDFPQIAKNASRNAADSAQMFRGPACLKRDRGGHLP
jgi:hypothetical protein